MQIIIKNHSELQELSEYMTQPLYQNTSITALLADKPDCHLLIKEAAYITAHCSLWYSEPFIENRNKKMGIIGHFEATSQTNAHLILKQACSLLRQHGCSAVIGPMNGNTWRKYRFVTQTNGNPPFLMEPQNPTEYPEYFRSFGFSNYASYYSTLETPIEYDENACNATLAKLKQDGIYLETLDMNHFEQQLDIIYELSLVCFKDNLFYTPLEKEDFYQQYLSFKDYILPQLVFFAYQDDKPIGFFFGIPDYNQKAHQKKIDTVLLKTIGVLPQYRQKRLGGLMISLAKQNAIQLGFQNAIYALMYQDNASRKFGQHVSPLRTYSLFYKELST